MTITARSVQASRANRVVIHTIECDLPTAILNQLLNHRAMSTSTSSVRAIPIAASVQQVSDNPSYPIWTAKNKGMSGPIITNESKIHVLNVMHKHAMATAMSQALAFDALDVHKQNAGRYLSPFQMSRLVITSTDWANWDWLRNDPDGAQPEIVEVARVILEARESAKIMDLEFGEYHVPFVTRIRNEQGILCYNDQDGGLISRDDAINISMSVCAQSSHRKADASIEKAERIVPLLLEGEKVHASPSEHVATPMLDHMVESIRNCVNGTLDESLSELIKKIPDGVTAINIDGTLGSGNFTNWIQYRQTLANHDAGIGEHVQESGPTKAEVELELETASEEEVRLEAQPRDLKFEGLANIIKTIADLVKKDGPEETPVSTPEEPKLLSSEQFEALSPMEQTEEVNKVLSLLMSKITKH